MPTRRDYRAALAKRLGGWVRAEISVDPDITDPLAQRSILSDALYGADKGIKAYSGHYAWVGKYNDGRTFRENGYRSLAYTVFTPHTGNYTMTLYGYGTTSTIDGSTSLSDQATALTNAMTVLNITATVTVDGTELIVAFSEVIDTEISAGTMISQGGIGSVETDRAFTRAPVRTDEFELSPKLPFDSDEHVQGLNEIINMALRKMWFIDRFPITPTRNVLGLKTFHGLTGFDWLVSEKQIIALFNPVRWDLTTTLTPPASSTFTLTLASGTTTFITDAIDFDATGQAIQDALHASGADTAITVTPLTANATYEINWPETWYASPAITPSAGTAVNIVTMLESPTRYMSVWKFQYNRNEPYIDNYFGQEGYSFIVEAYRQGHTWICPQTAYGTVGTIWEASNVGLEDDYDQAQLPVEDVATVAYAIACNQLAILGPGNELEYWQREAKKADRLSAGIKLFDLAFDDKPRGGQGQYGPSSYGSKGFWRAG